VTLIRTVSVALLRLASSFACASHPGLHAAFLKNLLVGKSDDICYIIPGFPIVITPQRVTIFHPIKYTLSMYRQPLEFLK